MKTSISVCHVDDDLRYIDYMKKIVTTMPELEYIGSASTAAEGLVLVNTLKPNILFLDIEMPAKDGFWLAERLKCSLTMIVFITSHSEFALDAFRFLALHYIVKPSERDDLLEIVARYRLMRNQIFFYQNSQLLDLQKLLVEKENYPNRIFINTKKRILVVELEEIVYVFANGSYSHFVLKGGEEIVSSKNLKSFSTILEKHPDFNRIHRTYIINQKYLKSVDKNGLNMSFKFNTGKTITVQSFRKDEWLHKFLEI